MSTLDQTQDISGRETHRLTALFPPPDFVKSASQDRVAGGDNLQRHMYADPLAKLYPCHTAPATWMSALFFEDKRALWSTLAEALRGSEDGARPPRRRGHERRRPPRR